MRGISKTGVMDVDYAKRRETKKSLRYRLWRRTYEVLMAIENFAPMPVRDIIDLGAADGRMLHTILGKYPDVHCVGVELNKDLIDVARSKYPDIEFILGDVQLLNFCDNSFDVAIATAVIEHVASPSSVIREAKRVLRPKGIFIITSPDPFWEHLATLLGHLPDDQHYETMNLQRLCRLVTRNGFKVIKALKFMLSPIGIPFEFGVEKTLRKLRLNFLMANQIVIARCGN